MIKVIVENRLALLMALQEADNQIIFDHTGAGTIQLHREVWLPTCPETIIIDSDANFLCLVEPDFKAIRNGIGLGREGFGCFGIVEISRKAESPIWRPPAEMIAHDPKAAKFTNGMPRASGNPLGVRALYLYQEVAIIFTASKAPTNRNQSD